MSTESKGSKLIFTLPMVRIMPKWRQEGHSSAGCPAASSGHRAPGPKSLQAVGCGCRYYESSRAVMKRRSIVRPGANYRLLLVQAGSR
jgi:hypothetical protein